MEQAREQLAWQKLSEPLQGNAPVDDRIERFLNEHLANVRDGHQRPVGPPPPLGSCL